MHVCLWPTGVIRSQIACNQFDSISICRLQSTQLLTRRVTVYRPAMWAVCESWPATCRSQLQIPAPRKLCQLTSYMCRVALIELGMMHAKDWANAPECASAVNNSAYMMTHLVQAWHCSDVGEALWERFSSTQDRSLTWRTHDSSAETRRNKSGSSGRWRNVQHERVSSITILESSVRSSNTHENAETQCTNETKQNEKKNCRVFQDLSCLAKRHAPRISVLCTTHSRAIFLSSWCRTRTVYFL